MTTCRICYVSHYDTVSVKILAYILPQRSQISLGSYWPVPRTGSGQVGAAPAQSRGGWRVRRGVCVLSMGGSGPGVLRSVFACVFMGTVSCLLWLICKYFTLVNYWHLSFQPVCSKGNYTGEMYKRKSPLTFNNNQPFIEMILFFLK